MRYEFESPLIERLKPEALLLKTSRGLVSRIRIAFYRALGMKIGKGCRFEAIRARRLSQIEVGCFTAMTEGCWLWPADATSEKCRIRIGSHNYFNRDVMIDTCGYVEIADHNLIGPYVYIADSNHIVKPGKTPKEQPMDVGTVKIGNGCWIGAHAVILKDVHLADGCVVGAGAVVTKSFPAGSIITGVPARLIGKRDLTAATELYPRFFNEPAAGQDG
ncbi:MAG: acyltransferase [Deltaproteobacteria bacterium]|nr:acyltransferase [Deltaproteobacteria bacterium]